MQSVMKIVKWTHTESNNYSGLANASAKRKVSFFSAILISINSTVGAGIFFKTDTVVANASNGLVFVIISWLVACFAVFCMGLAICEIASAKVGNLGISGWCQKFTSKYIYAASKNFMIYVYVPLLCFFTPIYTFKYFQDSLSSIGINNNFGTSFDWLIWSVIACVVVAWFMFSSGISTKIGNIQNWIISAVKFVPIVGVVIIGCSVWFLGENDPIDLLPQQLFNFDASDFFRLSPFFGLFGSLSAIIFSYGGFYAAAGIKEEMKNPQQNGRAIVTSVAVISIIYLLIALIMTCLSSQGSMFKNFFNNYPHLMWIFAVLNILIAIGTLGILNGTIIFGTRLVSCLIERGEVNIPCSYLLRSQFAKLTFSARYLFITYLPMFIILSIIGGMGYFSVNQLSSYDAYGFTSMDKLINFADLVSTWTLISAFAFICLALLGGIKNRKTNSVVVERKKCFVWASYFAVTLVFTCIIFLLAQPLVNLIWLINSNSLLIGNSLALATVLIFVLISFLPIYFTERIFRNRLGYLQDLLTITTTLSVLEIQQFNSTQKHQQIPCFFKLSRRNKVIHHLFVKKQWERFFKDENEKSQFNFHLSKKIMQIKSFLTS